MPPVNDYALFGLIRAAKYLTPFPLDQCKILHDRNKKGLPNRIDWTNPRIILLGITLMITR
jgi:hypothetical protein